MLFSRGRAPTLSTVLTSCLRALAFTGAVTQAGCNQTSQAVTLRSLESSGRFSFLCVGTRNPTAPLPEYGPRDLDDCPDQSPVDGEERHLISMVTQTTRGEVAMVDLTAGGVIDAERTVPGFNFLPIGAQPTSIVSTPGSRATFVGVAEVGKEGIFALPSSCILARREEGPVRDLTTWPACRLPSAPGDMAILIDPPGDPAQPDVYRPRCDEPSAKAEPQAGFPACPADLSMETKPAGRRKLAVALPDR